MDAAIDIAARISGATTDVATRVTGAIRDAARATGAGFEYLLNTAIRESNLNPNAKAKSSSATGLFQFIDQTWLGTMKQSGAGLGYGKYADAITRTPQGKFVVSDPAMRREIMALRKDPTANSLMAGAFANSNAKVLTDRLGRKPSDGELYMAHFLGASGAARFIKAAEARPDAKAANYFPRAAQANSSIFYDKQGGARSLKQVYAGLVARHDVIGTTRVAAAKPVEAGRAVKPTTQVAAAAVPVAAAPLAFFRDIPAAPGECHGGHAGVRDRGRDRDQRRDRIRAGAHRIGAAGRRDAARSSAARNRCSSRSISRRTAARSGRWCASCGARGAWRRSRRRMPLRPRRETPASGGANVNAPLDLFQFLRPSARRPA